MPSTQQLVVKTHQPFASISIVNAKNLTSKFDISQLERLNIIEVDEFGFSLGTPNQCCSVGHNFLFRFQIVEARGHLPIFFEVTAVVLEIDELEGESDRVVVELQQYETQSWKNFEARLNDRADQAMRLFNQIKYG